MDLLVFHPVLSLALHLLTTFLLVVLSLHFLEFAGKSLDFVLVLVDLGLVHVQLGCHSLHLVGLFLQVLLVDRQLLSDFRTWLAGKQVLQLDIELFLLLDADILLYHLLSLLDQPLLQGLDLVEQLPSVRVSALKFPPSVVIERVLKFLRECFDLETLFLESVGKAEDFLSEVVNLGSFALLNSQFAFEVANFEFQELDVLKTLLILNFTLCEGDLEDLNLLIK